MKKKTKRTLIVLLCVFVFIVAAGFAAYNIGMEYVQKKLVSSVVESMIEKGEISLSEIQAMTEEKSEVKQETEKEAGAEKESETGEEGSSSKVEKPAINDETKKKETESSKKTTPEKSDKKEKESEPESENKKEDEKTEAVDKFTEKIINSISRKEKLAMVKLITSHLSGGDISYLASLLAGGLTRDERAAAYRLAKQRFSVSELELVRSYYHSYKAQIMIEPDLVPKK